MKLYTAAIVLLSALSITSLLLTLNTYTLLQTHHQQLTNTEFSIIDYAGWTYKCQNYLRELVVPKNQTLPAFTRTTKSTAKCVLITFVVNIMDVEFCVQKDNEAIVNLNNPNCILHMNTNSLLSCSQRGSEYYVSCRIPFVFHQSFTLLFYNKIHNDRVTDGVVSWIHAIFFEEVQT